MNRVFDKPAEKVDYPEKSGTFQNSANIRRMIPGIVKYAVLIILFLFTAFPLVYVISGSVKSTADITRNVLIPTEFRFRNYAEVFSYPEIVLSFLNSTYIAAASVFIAANACLLAAYAIARRHEPIFKGWYLFFLSAMMVPGVSTLVMLYRLILNLGLMNTRTALILTYTSMTIPFGILILSGFIKTVPKSLDESAMIEGCGYFSRIYRIILPLTTFAVMIFIVLQLPRIWNDFLHPLLFIQNKWKMTVTLGVYNFSRVKEADYGAIFALLTTALLPPLLFFLFAQRYIYHGVVSGAVKE
jgi:raffinose/stachyose/melibiose transport system permease protein